MPPLGTQASVVRCAVALRGPGHGDDVVKARQELYRQAARQLAAEDLAAVERLTQAVQELDAAHASVAGGA